MCNGKHCNYHYYHRIKHIRDSKISSIDFDMMLIFIILGCKVQSIIKYE